MKPEQRGEGRPRPLFNGNTHHAGPAAAKFLKPLRLLEYLNHLLAATLTSLTD